MPKSLRLAAAGGLLVVPVLAGCTVNNNGGDTAGGDPRALTVRATDTECAVSAPSAPAGKVTFSVTNGGTKVNEFYLLGEDGQRIVGEVENIGPGLSRDLVLSVVPGSYFTACKPGMVGDGIRATFGVADSGESQAPTGDDAELVAEANRNYQAYVKDQTESLVTRTEQFVAAYKAGDDDRARELYPRARTPWERIEPVAESFGDLDPKVDLREADLEPGQEWTGWHRLEKDLWPQRAGDDYEPLSKAERAEYADDLMANTTVLYDQARDLEFTADQIANGSRGLLDEVATGKITGEEEYWSRTDLWDFQANVDGARVGFEGLRPLLRSKDPELDARIAERFADLQQLLDQHRTGDGFLTYDQLNQADVRQLSTAVDALSEPLSQLAAAVI